jgi:hypothetical protein
VVAQDGHRILAESGPRSSSTLGAPRLSAAAQPLPDDAHHLRPGGHYDGTVELPSGRAIIGGVLVLAIAAGFEYELAWLFIAGLILFTAWAGYMLMTPRDS